MKITSLAVRVAEAPRENELPMVVLDALRVIHQIAVGRLSPLRGFKVGKLLGAKVQETSKDKLMFTILNRESGFLFTRITGDELTINYIEEDDQYIFIVFNNESGARYIIESNK